MNILNIFVKMMKNRLGRITFQGNDNNTNVTFAQKDTGEVICYHCGEKGHSARTYPNKNVKQLSPCLSSNDG